MKLGSEKVTPDFGFSFERKDREFEVSEQEYLYQFIKAQMPPYYFSKIRQLLTPWYDQKLKNEFRMFYQFIIQGSAFKFYEFYSPEELNEKLKEYIKNRRKMVTENPNNIVHALINGAKDLVASIISKDLVVIKYFAFFVEEMFFEEGGTKKTADRIYKIIQNHIDRKNSEETASSLVKLREEDDLFDRVGIGFLGSLIPEDKLEEHSYIKLEMYSVNAEGQSYPKIEYIKGNTSNRELYSELEKIQFKLASRSYDLRLSPEDEKMFDQLTGKYQPLPLEDEPTYLDYGVSCDHMTSKCTYE